MNRLSVLSLTLALWAAPSVAAAQWECGGDLRSTRVELARTVRLLSGGRQEPLDRHVPADRHEDILDAVHEFVFRFGFECGRLARVTLAYDASARRYSVNVEILDPAGPGRAPVAVIRIPPADGNGEPTVPHGVTALEAVEAAVTHGRPFRPDARDVEPRRRSR